MAQQSKNMTLVLPADTRQLLRLQTFLEELSQMWALDHEALFAMNLALEELVTNTIFYGYADKLPHFIQLDFARDDSDLITIVMTDDGKPFNILQAPDADSVDKPAEEREIGGLGIHFVKTFMKRITYERVNENNKLTLWYQPTGSSQQL